VDVVEAFWRAQDALHGYEIKKRTKRTGPTVYNNLDRLKELGWIAGAWEASNPEPGRPPRRIYRLTPDGRVQAEKLLISTGRIKTDEDFHPVTNGGDL
jgi:DNA-binding PadR family transcriptional regulator